MISGVSINQLHIHAKSVTSTLCRTLQHITDVQLTTQLSYVDGFALEGERGVPRNHERAADARQVRGQALGHAIHEILLLGIAADIRKRQHHDGQTRSGRWHWRGLMSIRAQADRIGTDRTGDVLEGLLAKINKLN